MTHVTGAMFALAAAGAMLAVWVVRGSEAPKAKADMLRIEPAARVGSLAVVAGRPTVAEPVGAPAPIAPAEPVEWRFVWPPLDSPPPSQATHGHAVAAAGASDRVCGARGRVWRTKPNGWRYWRCQR
jgi:hypothetical protein